MDKEETSRQQEVQRLLDLLQGQLSEERLHTARELREIGVRKGEACREWKRASVHDHRRMH